MNHTNMSHGDLRRQHKSEENIFQLHLLPFSATFLFPHSLSVKDTNWELCLQQWSLRYHWKVLPCCLTPGSGDLWNIASGVGQFHYDG